jgi:hypothetical protein
MIMYECPIEGCASNHIDGTSLKTHVIRTHTDIADSPTRRERTAEHIIEHQRVSSALHLVEIIGGMRRMVYDYEQGDIW